MFIRISEALQNIEISQSANSWPLFKFSFELLITIKFGKIWNLIKIVWDIIIKLHFQRFDIVETLIGPLDTPKYLLKTDGYDNSM